MNLIYKYHFIEKESDITIISESKDAILKAKEVFYYNRKILENFVLKNKKFLKSFTPVKIKTDLPIIKKMIQAAEKCDVGPMAAVAGALADIMLETMISKDNINLSPAINALVENGGEIAVDSQEPMKIALYAGENQLNLNIGFLIQNEDCPLGIGTSSATIGHAISLGQADAATIFAKNAALADAAATKVANMVKGNDIEKSIKKGLDTANDINGVYGAFISRNNKIGSTGKIPRLFKIEGEKGKILEKKVKDVFLGDYEIIT